MLTREEFQAIYDLGPEATLALFHITQEQVAALEARIKELEARLNKDSHNSSNPPSTDGLKKKPASLRKPSDRKPGGQRGHKAHNLEPVEKPDHIIAHVPSLCNCCGADLTDAEVVGVEKHQVFDLPPLRIQVTEHTATTKKCACGQLNTAPFPEEAAQPTQYGPRIKGMGVYLRDYHLLPYERTAQIFADVFGVHLSKGTLYKSLVRASKVLQPVNTAIKEGIKKAQVVGFDETGARVAGKLNWLHSASTATLTYYHMHAKRGQEGIKAAGILPDFSGTAVHDGWVCYASYTCDHALCNAHHLRELKALQEEGQTWAGEMSGLLVAVKAEVDLAKDRGRKSLSPLLLCEYEARYRKLISAGYAANPPPSCPPRDKRGRVKQSPARNLLDRLSRQKNAVLAFAYDFAVPFDNNQSERDIRMTKVRQKVSGGFRSGLGAQMFCGLRGYISTLRKQGMPLLSALEQAFRGQPVYPVTTPVE